MVSVSVVPVDFFRIILSKTQAEIGGLSHLIPLCFDQNDASKSCNRYNASGDSEAWGIGWFSARSTFPPEVSSASSAEEKSWLNWAI